MVKKNQNDGLGKKGKLKDLKAHKEKGKTLTSEGAAMIKGGAFRHRVGDTTIPK
jgi:hypothetical protein